MGLTGTPTAVLVAVLLLAMSVCTVMIWQKLDILGWGRWPARLGLIGGCQLGAVLLAALLVNDTFIFYGSWSELFGAHPTSDRPAASAGALDARLGPELTAHYRTGHGSIVSIAIPGTRSGVHTGPASVYLPPQYGDPATPGLTFPVVELLVGYPGAPTGWVRDLHIGAVLDSLIDTGRSAPFIAVMPVQNVAMPRDTECVNALHGPQVDSYLSYDVHTAIDRAVRASRSPWSVLGYSTGGYCAEDLAIRHPDLFTAAVSLAGYNSPAHDPTTEHLFGDEQQLSRQYNAVWRIRHHEMPGIHLLLISTRTDALSYLEAKQLIDLNRPPLQLSVLTLPRGGHNFATFGAELPTSFGWLSRYVPAGLTQIPSIDGLAPQLVPYRPSPSNRPVQRPA